jgi:hypothetical protein
MSEFTVKKMNTINMSEVINIIETEGIKVIPIGYGKSNSNELKGSLEDFIAAAKAFEEPIVFLQEFPFDNESFLHEAQGEILGEYDEPANENGIDLTQFLPKLKDYKKYIEQTSFLIFRVFYKNQAFDYYHYAEWFTEFNKLLEEAEQIFEEKEEKLKIEQAERKIAARQEVEQRNEVLSAFLEELADDDKFLSLKTQKAQQEYALARYPELAELSSNVLKDKISNLKARLDAKKMLQ